MRRLSWIAMTGLLLSLPACTWCNTWLGKFGGDSAKVSDADRQSKYEKRLQGRRTNEAMLPRGYYPQEAVSQGYGAANW